MPSTECLTVVPLTGDETAHHRDDWCRDGIIAAIHRGERGGGKAGVIAVSGAAERRASRRYR